VEEGNLNKGGRGEARETEEKGRLCAEKRRVKAGVVVGGRNLDEPGRNRSVPISSGFYKVKGVSESAFAATDFLGFVGSRINGVNRDAVVCGCRSTDRAANGMQAFVRTGGEKPV